MKAIFKSSHLLLLAITAILSVTIVSCKKNDPVVTPAANTITDIVVGGADFSTLEAAVLKAGLAETLKGTGPFTVFAPDNAAFTASGITSIDGLTPDALRKILLYHTLAAKVMAADVPAGPNAPVSTANSPAETIYVTKNANGVFINGIKVKTADVAADNGVVHVIEKVLIPASGNVVATAIAATGGDNGLDSLVAAVVRADAAYPGLINTLSTATITVFAPTNKAFRDLLTALGASKIDDIPIATLYAVLAHHVVGARAFSSDLANGPLPMFDTKSTTINLTNGTGGGPTIKGAAVTAVPSNIIATNILCTNGVVHVIDRVLLP